MGAARSVTRFAPMRGRRTPWILRFPVGCPVDLLPLSVVTADARVLTDVGGALLRRGRSRVFLSRRLLAGGLSGQSQHQTDW